MDPRRPSRVIDPKVRKVGFFTTGPPPDGTQSGPAETTPAQSPVSNSISPVMIPHPRHTTDNLSRAVGVRVPAASQLHAHPPLDSLQVGSYTLTDSVLSPSPTQSLSSRIGIDGEFSEDSVNWMKRSNSGRFTAANPAGGPDLSLSIQAWINENSGDVAEVMPLKAKTTKAERRALQEAQRAAKASAKEIIEGMIGYIQLPAVMMKLLFDNSRQSFGDFKDTAGSIIEDDAYYTMKLLKKEASHGHGPQSLICCFCNSLLKTGIQVYNCGHATHLHCSLSSGCPICMPDNKGPARSENGLVNKTLPKHKLPQDTGSVHVHENDRQLSRYEILTNLDKVKVDNMPQLRLAPPVVYHEKVEKAKVEKINIKNNKKKRSGVGLLSKSSIFGKERHFSNFSAAKS